MEDMQHEENIQVKGNEMIYNIVWKRKKNGDNILPDPTGLILFNSQHKYS